MELAVFFAGMQALAAFIQAWQSERDSSKAARRYFEAKVQALNDPTIQEKATRLNSYIQEHPVLGKLLRNRFGRCEDEFEDALRKEDEEKLNDAAKAFVKCKCLIMETIKTAQGSLPPDLQEEWKVHQCEVVLN